MWFLFDEIGLLIVIVGCFFGGFMPMFILLLLTPEARTHIKARIMGGIIIDRIFDTGQEDYLHAKPMSNEGQYIAGKNQWGMRQIFIKPHMLDASEPRFSVKPFFLEGIRRPKYFCYAGKVPMVNAETLMAIEVAEAQLRPVVLPSEFRSWVAEKNADLLSTFDKEAETNTALQKKALPPHIEAWAKENGMTFSEPVYEEVEEKTWSDPDEKGHVHVVSTQKIKKITGYKNVYYSLYSIDPRKLGKYYSRHYDESQVDDLIEKGRLEGLTEGREGKKFHFGKLGWLMVALIIISVGGIVLLKVFGAF